MKSFTCPLRLFMFVVASMFPLGRSIVISNGPPNVPGSLIVTVVYNDGAVVTKIGELIVTSGLMPLLQYITNYMV